MLIVGRAPRPGTVKIRLHPILGPRGCARLQGGLIAATLARACEFAPNQNWLAVNGAIAAPRAVHPLTQR